MKFNKELIQNHPIVFYLTALFIGFIAGINADKFLKRYVSDKYILKEIVMKDYIKIDSCEIISSEKQVEINNIENSRKIESINNRVKIKEINRLENEFIIKGTVKNLHNEYLEGVKVYTNNNQKTLTNQNGYFELLVKNNNLTLTFSKEGFISKSKNISKSENQSIHEILLEK